MGVFVKILFPKFQLDCLWDLVGGDPQTNPPPPLPSALEPFLFPSLGNLDPPPLPFQLRNYDLQARIPLDLRVRISSTGPMAIAQRAPAASAGTPPSQPHGGLAHTLASLFTAGGGAGGAGGGGSGGQYAHPSASGPHHHGAPAPGYGTAGVSGVPVGAGVPWKTEWRYEGN